MGRTNVATLARPSWNEIASAHSLPWLSAMYVVTIASITSLPAVTSMDRELLEEFTCLVEREGQAPGVFMHPPSSNRACAIEPCAAQLDSHALNMAFTGCNHS